MRTTSASAMLVVLVGVFLSPGLSSAMQQNIVRWTPDEPGCEFAQLPDGTYRYAISSRDIVVTLAVDSQELQKSQTRVEPVIALFVSVRASGDHNFEVLPEELTLEFKKHYQEQHQAINRGRLAEKLRKDLAELERKAVHKTQKHPENEAEERGKQQKQAILGMISFLQSKSLQRTAFDSNAKQTSGWIFFETRSRWIHQLDSQEEFILRVPVGQTVFEFPFVLPPSRGDVNLRTRPAE